MLQVSDTRNLAEGRDNLLFRGFRGAFTNRHRTSSAGT